VTDSVTGSGAAPAGSASRELSGYQDGFAEVTDGRLYYQMAGSGDSVVLVHGNVGDHRHWDGQFEYLASRRRVVRYDLRGYGKSSEPAGSSYSDYSDLAQLLEYLDVAEANVAGWSFGSGVAFDFAIAFPERVKTLVSVAPWVNGHSSEAVDAFFAMMRVVKDAAARGGPGAARDAFVDLVLGDSILTESAHDFVRKIAADFSWSAFAKPSQKIALEPTSASQLGKLTVPVLLVTADHDLPVCREMADLVVSRAPHARQVILRNTGHVMHIESPDTFNAELLAFLDDPQAVSRRRQ
jgi:pimeloyl-ACP methyl ester carboxylesterase